MGECIAIINAGSSSIKFALYELGPAETPLFNGQIEKIGVSPRLKVKDAAGNKVAEQEWPAEGFDHRAGTNVILKKSVELVEGKPIVAVGHRVVHGGTNYAAPIRINANVVAALDELVPLAPLHQPHNLSPIRTISEVAPHIPQVACFDTAFHRRQPDIAQLFAIPRKFTEAGVRRYGFHGLSYEYVSGRLYQDVPELTDARIVICHLGNGASMCAVRNGRSMASTMGFTAVDGLMMGTRCGAIDPGVLLYLMDSHGMDARAIEDLVYKQSGLLGVSGISSDVRSLRESTEPAAAEALALFTYRVVREVGSLAAALGGLDALVFTGGIGENDKLLRAEVAARCSWLGVAIDPALNDAGKGRISPDGAGVSVWVVTTNEELMIARHTTSLLGLGSVSSTAAAAAPVTA